MKTLNLCLGLALLIGQHCAVAAIADRFDYPIGNRDRYTEANDGDGWYSAQEFGEWNTNFFEYHLGEDWNAESGGNSDCGLPVYAVANGTIVYAAIATGWGRVLIVRHTLPDGTLVESLYGHLGSFAKTSGDVARGEQVGTIGDGHEGGTTYPCHLHLEIRTAACPNWGQPGPGYSVTSMPVGWTDPSGFLDAHAGVDLSGSWSLKGKDTGGTTWYADATITQTNDAGGKHLSGHFDWDTANIGAYHYGREYFTGTFDEAHLTIHLVCSGLENAYDIACTPAYDAKVSPDGLLLYEGTWGGGIVVPSYDWSAVLCRVVDSSFQTHLEGWQVTGNGTLAWQPSGGDPGGYANAQDAATDAVLRLVAPTKYLGGWRFASQALGLISIDTRLFSYSGSRNSGPAFRISGPGGSAEIVRPVAAGPSQSQWQSLVVPLDPSFWTVTTGTWNQLLTNVAYFDVNAEFASGGSSDGFDNIRLLLPGREMDVTSPRVAWMSPNPGSVLLQSPGTIDLRFTESLDVRTLSPRTIRLLRSGGDSSFDQGNEVVVPFSALTWTSPANLRCTLGGAGLPSDVYEMVLNGWESRNCLSFDGSDAYVRVPNAAALNPTAAITVEAWVNPASFPNWATVVVKSSSYSWSDGYGLAHYTGANDINFFVNSYSGPHASGTLPAGQWSHVAGSYDGSQVKLHINGQLVSSVAQSGAIRSSAANLTIGWAVGNGFWRGSIDDVRIWNVARTAEDIRRNMYGLLSGNESGLVASWAFDEGTGQVLNDQSPYHHDGTLGANNSKANDDPEWTMVKSITDMAGNALDGEFFSVWPSGDALSGGDFIATFTVQAAPRITIDPQTQTAFAGGNVTMSVVAVGDGPMFHQWRFNGQDILGATGKTLTVTNCTASNSGGYSVVVWNAYGSVVSATAHLAVLTDGANGTQPQQITAPLSPAKPPTQDSLVVVTHGYFLPRELPVLPSWVTELCDAIRARVPANWAVTNLDWSGWARQPLPDLAVIFGVIVGDRYGADLGMHGWQNLHLIGNSAGAAVVEAIAHRVKHTSPGTTIHSSFLAPYRTTFLTGTEVYGANADWADCYVAQDWTAMFTSGPLDQAWNADASWTDPNRQVVPYPFAGQVALSHHDWPHSFYLQTVTNTDSGWCATDWGFALSMERGGWGNHAGLVPGNTPLVLCGPASAVQNPLPIFTAPAAAISDLAHAFSTAGAWLLGRFGFQLSGSPTPYSPKDARTPPWLAVALPITNAVNFVQFDAGFTDTNAAQGLLTVYWNTNLIGMVDERVAPPGLQTYRFPLPAPVSEGVYTLSFRLDLFGQTASSVTVTNVATGFVGLTQPITLAMLPPGSNTPPVLQLTAPAGYNYLIQSSTNLTTWAPAALLVNMNGTVLFADPAATNSSQRFYRAVMP